MITSELIMQICPLANKELVASLIDPMNKYLPLYEINTLLRLSNFLGQAGEESDTFKTLTEYASGVAYNNRKDLGNTQPGDGPRFKGRGIFMVTGRSNYTSIGKTLGIDLVNNPLLASTPEVAVQTACLYWKTHNLNALADNNDIVGITKKINGGTNGLSTRQLYTYRAATDLKTSFNEGNFFESVVTKPIVVNVVTNTAVSSPTVVISPVNKTPAPPIDPIVVTPTLTAPEKAQGESFFTKIKNFFDLGSDFWKRL